MVGVNSTVPRDVKASALLCASARACLEPMLFFIFSTKYHSDPWWREGCQGEHSARHEVYKHLQSLNCSAVISQVGFVEKILSWRTYSSLALRVLYKVHFSPYKGAPHDIHGFAFSNTLTLRAGFYYYLIWQVCSGKLCCNNLHLCLCEFGLTSGHSLSLVFLLGWIELGQWQHHWAHSASAW